ncbi:MAG: hypothetical protein AABY53_08630 [Bdellovibrionota bacterium]
MTVLLLGLVIMGFEANAKSESVREWWEQCKGNTAKSSCLSDSELDAFKTICSNKVYKEDCNKVINYAVARTRVTEGKSLLLSGYDAQLSSFSERSRYLIEPEKIWVLDKVDKPYSFAVGIIPACGSASSKKLAFAKNLRQEVKDLQGVMLRVYESLATMPCTDSNKEFVLVTIGKVRDSSSEYEIYTVDEKRNLKVVQTALGRGPFN